MAYVVKHSFSLRAEISFHLFLSIVVYTCTTYFHLLHNETVFVCLITTRENFLKAAYEGNLQQFKQLLPQVDLNWKEEVDRRNWKVSSESCSTSGIKEKSKFLKHFFVMAKFCFKFQSCYLVFVWVYDLAPFDASDKALLSHTYPLLINRKNVTP